jgi:surface polysaccharide O-acyltransferase-like enzyme
MTLTAFLLLLNFNYSWIGERPRKLINSIARTSFAIYLVHIIFVDLEGPRPLPGIGSGTILILSEFLVKFLSIFILSYLVSLFLLEIPILKRIFGA